GKLDGDAKRRLRGALAAPGLEHPKLTLLDREFEVLHVAIVPLERALDALERSERFRQRLFHRRLVGTGLFACRFGDLLGRANAGDDVLALSIDQIFAVEFFLAGHRLSAQVYP